MPSIRDLFKKTNTQTGLGAGLNLNTWDNSGTFTTGVAFDGNDSKFIVPKVTTVARTAVTPLEAEIIYDSDEEVVYYGNGTTLGGVKVGTSTLSDSVFRIQDNTDATKQIAFEASGITTGTTRTLTVPDANGTIGLDYTLVSTKTSNYTAQNLEKIPCNTNAGGFTITTPVSGKFQVIDILGTTPTTGFGVTGKNLTITPASGTIMGDTSLVLNIGAISPEFQLIGTDWRIVNHG